MVRYNPGSKELYYSSKSGEMVLDITDGKDTEGQKMRPTKQSDSAASQKWEIHYEDSSLNSFGSSSSGGSSGGGTTYQTVTWSGDKPPEGMVPG